MTRTAAALLLGVLVVTGCSDDDPSPAPEREPTAEPAVSAEEAPEVYGTLLQEVVDALVGYVPAPGRPDGDPPSVYDDGDRGCRFASVRYEFADVFGEGTSWEAVRANTAPVLEREGFELTEQLDIPGGHNGFDAVAEDGATVEVRSKLGEPSTISLDAPVTGSC